MSSRQVKTCDAWIHDIVGQHTCSNNRDAYLWNISKIENMCGFCFSDDRLVNVNKLRVCNAAQKRLQKMKENNNSSDSKKKKRMVLNSNSPTKKSRIPYAQCCLKQRRRRCSVIVDYILDECTLLDDESDNNIRGNEEVACYVQLLLMDIRNECKKRLNYNLDNVIEKEVFKEVCNFISDMDMERTTLNQQPTNNVDPTNNVSINNELTKLSNNMFKILPKHAFDKFCSGTKQIAISLGDHQLQDSYHMRSKKLRKFIGEELKEENNDIDINEQITDDDNVIDNETTSRKGGKKSTPK